MAINKVVYNNRTLIDLTNDTVTAADVVSGKTFHLADGTSSTGAGQFIGSTLLSSSQRDSVYTYTTDIDIHVSNETCRLNVVVYIGENVSMSLQYSDDNTTWTTQGNFLQIGQMMPG